MQQVQGNWKFDKAIENQNCSFSHDEMIRRQGRLRINQT